MNSTIRVLLALAFALTAVGFAAYQRGYDNGYADGFEGGDAAGYQAGYDLGYDRGREDAFAEVPERSLSVDVTDVVYNDQTHQASFEMEVTVSGNIESNESLVMVCYAPGETNPENFVVWDVTILKGYYNWDDWYDGSVMNCKAQITADDGTVVVESEEVELKVLTGMNA